MHNRYSRQELFAPIGKEGQKQIRSASAVIVGCGALGSLLAEVMTRAGIGKLTIIDRDFVESSNLQRQALFSEEDARSSTPKAIAASSRLHQINGEVEIKPVVADLSIDNLSLLSDAQLILDGTDNFQTRYLLNDYAWKNEIPWIYGACVGSTGVASVFIPPDFPCLRCIFEAEPPPGSAPTCDTAGILWSAVGAVVSYQVAAAFKVLVVEKIHPEILQLDVWENHYHVVSLSKAKRIDCPTCGLHQYPALTSRGDFETSLCGRDAVQVKPQKGGPIDLDAIEARWKQIGRSYRNPFLAKLILDQNEIVLFSDGRAIVKGTQDVARARDLYSKYVGT